MVCKVADKNRDGVITENELLGFLLALYPEVKITGDLRAIVISYF